MAPISAPILGIHFFRGRFSLKNGTICPLSGHDSSYFKNMCLLIEQKKRRLLCIGRTSTGSRTDYFHYCPFQLSFSWGSAPARVKASKRVKYTCLKYFCLYKNYRYSIQWRSVNTGLIQWCSRGFDTDMCCKALFH
jgi:hypothetical protein